MQIQTVNVWEVKRLPAKRIAPAIANPDQSVAVIAPTLAGAVASKFTPLFASRGALPGMAILHTEAATRAIDAQIGQFEQLASMAKFAGDPRAGDFQPFLYAVGAKKGFEKLISEKSTDWQKTAGITGMVKNGVGMIKFAAPQAPGIGLLDTTCRIIDCAAGIGELAEKFNDPDRKLPVFLYQALKTGVGMGSLVAGLIPALQGMKGVLDSAGLFFKIGDKVFLAVLGEEPPALPQRVVGKKDPGAVAAKLQA